MRTITRVAYENMKYYKSKNILIGIAVCLTTLLLFLVPTIGKNMIDGKYAVVNEIYPTWHALYRDVDANTLEKLSVHHNISSFGLRSDTGYIIDDNAEISMMYLDENGFSMYRIMLSEGKIPVKENEIVLSTDILEEMGQNDKKVGDTIVVPFQIFRNEGLDQTDEKEFIISGILENGSSSNETKMYTAFISKDFLQNEVPENQISYRFLFQVIGKMNAVTDDVENSINSIAKQFSIPEKNILINEEYLMANYIDPTMVLSITVIMVIIIFAGVITIYSVYYVGMTERIQMFGKLKAIGATKSQIKQIALREGLGIAVVAIVVGLIIGTLLSKATFLVFLSFYKDENSIITTMKQLLNENQFSLYHWWIYLLTIGITLLTVYLSLWKPINRAANISEMEAIRYLSGNLGQEKKRRMTESKRKSFAYMTIPKLSYIYLIGNKKNSAITIISMAITGVLLMVVATVLSCANPAESANNSILEQYEIAINVEPGNKEHPEREWSNIVQDNPLNNKLKEKIEAIDGIKSVISFDYVNISAEMFEGDFIGICGVPVEYSDKLVKGIIDGKATYNELKSGDKVIVDKNLLYWYPDLSIGEVLNIEIKDASGSHKKEVEIIAIGDYETGFTKYNYLLMADEGARKLSGYNINGVYHIIATEKYNENTEKALKQLISADSDRLVMQTWKEIYDEWSSAIAMTGGACYIFFGVLGSICVMNIINTMIHSVHVRKKELGMMQALGMTNRQLLTMLQQEGLFYTIGTLLISVGVGSILGYPVFLWAKLDGMYNISNYHYPVVAAVIISAVLLFIQLVLTIILGRVVRKESLINRIRFGE